MEGLSNYEKEVRPWGNFERYTANELSTVKIITANPNEALSLQTHTHRSEFWRILSGSGTVSIDSMKQEAHPGDTFYINQGAAHRMEAGPNGVVWLEIALGQFDEADITRLEDKYGRT
ncbi:MAG TPA: phosphomannose isomerase type II C-terminal cupin domain [Candidatus Paceibacterota bacterium]